MKNDISKITTQKLCTGCGSCAAVCPVNCIQMREEEAVYTAAIDTKKCIQCGICLSVCPQTEINTPVPTAKKDFAGPCLSCFTGAATDTQIRKQASSGGIATALGLYALRTGLVDGIISVKADSSNPLRFKSTISRSTEEFLTTKGSKYCPVSMNGIIKELLTEKNNNKYLYIGLPCHTKGLKRLMHIKPELREKIYATASLFCSHTPTFTGTEFLLKKKGIDKDRIKEIHYRGNGWPGTLQVKTQDNDFTFKAQDGWGKYFAHRFFGSKHCLICDDLFGRDSDIALGDAWLPEFKDDNLGTSIGIIHTPRGMEIIEKAKTSKQIDIQETILETVLKSQPLEVAFKHRLISGRKRILLKDKNFPKPRLFKERFYNRFILLNAAATKKQAVIRGMLKLKGFPEKVFFKITRTLRQNILGAEQNQ